MLCVIIFLKIEINTIIVVEIMWLYYFCCMDYATFIFFHVTDVCWRCFNVSGTLRFHECPKNLNV